MSEVGSLVVLLIMVRVACSTEDWDCVFLSVLVFLSNLVFLAGCAATLGVLLLWRELVWMKKWPTLPIYFERVRVRRVVVLEV